MNAYAAKDTKFFPEFPRQSAEAGADFFTMPFPGLSKKEIGFSEVKYLHFSIQSGAALSGRAPFFPSIIRTSCL
ncbi:MAG: hypothetical protein ACM3Q4_14100 [Acidobacteriota bacterium]